MIELHMSPNIDCHSRIKERLEEMSLARKVIESKDILVPLLKESSETYEGCEEINTFLNQFESVVEKWYECRCDKYEFD